MSTKKYIVSLNESERAKLQEVVKKLKRSSQKVKRANILLKADDSNSVPLAVPVQTEELLSTKSRLPSANSVTREPPKLCGLSDDQVG